MSKWKLIETAPKDGTRILVWPCEVWRDEKNAPATARWCDTYSKWECDPSEATEYDTEPIEPTHWMPVPEPPPAASKKRMMEIEASEKERQRLRKNELARLAAAERKRRSTESQQEISVMWVHEI